MIPDETIKLMWADYCSGMSLNQVAKKYGRGYGGMGHIFRRRGYQLRYSPRPKTDPITGRVMPVKQPTSAELKEIISKMTRISVPKELRTVWRHWPMKKRGAFIAQVRKHLANPHERPATPFSDNVVPFDYTTASAWAIVKELNKGTCSRTWKARLLPASQGVIYQGRLWYWCAKQNGGAYYIGTWTAENGRPSLHHTIWEENFGPVPEGMTVIFKDGNHNNLLADNLALRSRAQCALENSLQARIKKDPTNPQLQALNRQRIANGIETRRQRSRKLTSLLLTQHQQGQRSLAALKG